MPAGTSHSALSHFISVGDPPAYRRPNPPAETGLISIAILTSCTTSELVRASALVPTFAISRLPLSSKVIKQGDRKAEVDTGALTSFTFPFSYFTIRQSTALWNLVVRIKRKA